MSFQAISKSIDKLAKPKRSKLYQSFFKTGVGEYAEGDIFKGVTNPEARIIAKENMNISYKQLEKTLKSPIHEERFVALVIMTHKFSKQPEKIKKFYLSHLDWVNHWDLVDCSAYQILGKYLLDKEDKSILFQLAKSDHLWSKRISIVSTYTFIKNDILNYTMEIAKILLPDEHDLIHKAVGWMLREVGKKDKDLLEEFIKENYDMMPRTCLRYAIEKFEQTKRKKFLKKQFQ